MGLPSQDTTYSNSLTIFQTERLHLQLELRIVQTELRIGPRPYLSRGSWLGQSQRLVTDDLELDGVPDSLRPWGANLGCHHVSDASRQGREVT